MERSSFRTLTVLKEYNAELFERYFIWTLKNDDSANPGLMRGVGLDRQEALEVVDRATIDVIDLTWGILDKDRQHSLEWFEMCLRTSELLWTFWILREFPELVNQKINGEWPIFIAIDAGSNTADLIVQLRGPQIDRSATNGRGRTLRQYYDDLVQEKEPDAAMIRALRPLFAPNDRSSRPMTAE
jgi:hypothetical protein